MEICINKDMTYITKLLILALILNGCSYIDTYKEVSSQVLGVKFINSTALINTQHSNQIRVEYKGEYPATFKLLKESGDLQYWVSNHEESLITHNMKVIKTVGFDNDFEIISYPNITYVLKQLTLFKKDHITLNSFVKFTNPETSYMDINFSYNIESSSSNPRHFLLEEIVEIPKIKSKQYNYYWVNNKLDIIKTKQTVIPGSKIRIN